MNIDLERLVAHINHDTGRAQSLIEHLSNCASYAKEMGALIGIPHMCFLLGLLHDAGKHRNAFQKYIREGTNTKVVHSSTGARLIKKLSKLVLPSIEDKLLLKNEKRSCSLYNEILIYAILAHHGLFDIVTEDFLKVELRLNDFDGDKLYEKESEEEFFRVLNAWVQDSFNKSLEKIYLEGLEEFIRWNKKKEELLVIYNKDQREDRRVAQTFYDGCMMRVLLSILKEADIYDSANFGRVNTDKKYSLNELEGVWETLANQTHEFYSSLRKQGIQSDLNTIRNKLADEVLEKASICGSGNFKLDMPVGSGKTYAALQFAIENAKVFKKSRIFYTTAYLSVLEQNAKQIRNVLTANGKDLINDEYILEHHSNVVDDAPYLEKFELDSTYGINTEEEDYGYTNYLRESWEAPVILTTVVQLSNTLFKSKAASIRRFSKLINSTIIVDEIQSLPINTVYIYNLMMNFLVKCMKVTLIHCTATPPSYDQKEVLKHPCIYGLANKSLNIKALEKNSRVTELTSKEHSNNNVFLRVAYRSLLGADWRTKLSTNELVAHICDRLSTKKSILVVLNTKRAVEKLYNALNEKFKAEYSTDFEEISNEIENNIGCNENAKEPRLYYLTTNQCAAHRLDFIEEIKLHLKRLRNEKSSTPLICISTRLIEAGVDVDFDVVYRDLIGIASIIQSAGRCNREGKLKSKGTVYLMEYEESNSNKLETFQKEISATRATLWDIDKNNLKYCEEDSSYAMKNSIYELLFQYYSQLYQFYNNTSLVLFYPTLKRHEKISLLEFLSTNITIKNEYYLNHNDDQLDYLERLMRKDQFLLNQAFKTAGDDFKLIDDNTLTVIVLYRNNELINELYRLLEEIVDKKNISKYRELKYLIKKLQPYTISVRKDNLEKYENYLNFELEKRICLLSEEGYSTSVGLIKGSTDTLIY